MSVTMTVEEPVSQGETWYVFKRKSQVAWVPQWTVDRSTVDEDDPVEVAQATLMPGQAVPEGAVKFAGGNQRDAVERAELLGAIQDSIEESVGLPKPLELSTEMTRIDNMQKLVPAIVAGQGPPLVAAHLAVQDVSNRQIAKILDVQPRTVSQYISDLKSDQLRE